MKPRLALLIIDMMNDFQFEEGDELASSSVTIAKKIATLKKAAKEQAIPVIYVNDNYGRWQSDFNEVIQHCKNASSSAEQIIQWLQPETSDYFVLKPQFSGFFYTPLDLLLRELDVRSLLITGIAGNMCVQFTASDAYMRGFALNIPEDTTASSTVDQHERSIDMFKDVLGADTTASDQLNFIHLLKRADEHYAKTN